MASHTGPIADTPGARKHPRLRRWVERIRNTLAYAVARRFVELDLMAQAAALSLYALISLAPLVLLMLWFTGWLGPSAQEAQCWQESTMQPTPTRSPTLNLVTSPPTAVTWPTISWPGTHG